ncbi:MAG: SLBB domain-containing protein [bacterium]|nr:SLBB domain-containing protein [bacterium]
MKSPLARMMVLFVVTSLIIVASNNTVLGQDEKYPRGAQYFLGTDDQLLIKVNIWGFVAKPGQYLVPSGTDLVSLISFAGGPREQAKLSNITIIRATSTAKSRNQVMKINVDQFIKYGDQQMIPKLNPDDTVIVYGSRWYHISKYLEFMTKIAMLFQIYAWVAYYTTRK